MPRLSCWFIRSALIHLALGFTFGALLLGNKGMLLHGSVWHLLPAHIEFLLFGWTVQLALGVVFWILPRFYTRRRHEPLAWLSFALLNIGVWLAGLGPVFAVSSSVTRLGRCSEACAVLTFVMHIWPRIKAPGVSG